MIIIGPGALHWIRELKWPGLNEFRESDRVEMQHAVTKRPIAWRKQHKNFKFYWVLDAGHAVSTSHSTDACCRRATMPRGKLPLPAEKLDGCQVFIPPPLF